MTQTGTRLPFRTITVTAAARQGLAPRRITPEALAAWLPADGSVAPMWERIGNVHGQVEYGISHMRATAGGVEVVLEDGNPIIRFPFGQGRFIRILGAA